jgi:uncharacterized OB-fold protein
MAMLEELATLNPDLNTREFWEACAKRELRFQRCKSCGAYRFPPLSGCRHCGSAEARWVTVSGRGSVFSYTVVHHAAIPQIEAEVPYGVVVVEFDDAPGARLISNVVDLDPAELRVGMPLELVWEEPRPGVVLPRFRSVR